LSTPSIIQANLHIHADMQSVNQKLNHVISESYNESDEAYNLMRILHKQYIPASKQFATKLLSFKTSCSELGKPNSSVPLDRRII
jgi:hypothetical protein